MTRIKVQQFQMSNQELEVSAKQNCTLINVQKLIIFII